MSPFQTDFEITVRAGEAEAPAIEVRGELDSGTCEELMDAFRSLGAEPPKASLTLDLSRVSFIDSAGTRAVILIEREARERGINLAIAAPPGEVTELLRTAGVIEHFHLRPGTRGSGLDASTLLERVELELPRDPQSPARARAEVRELLAGHDRTQVGDVVLLASEIVTNAVVHPDSASGAPIGLRIFTYEEGVRIEVDDDGQGFDVVARAEPEDERGRGLFLVDRFSSRWGTGHIRADRGRRFVVWFEFDWSQPSRLETATA